MDERKLLSISFIFAMVGISILYFLDVTQEVESVPFLESKMGSVVKVNGVIRDIKRREGFVLLKVEKKDLIDVILFKDKGDYFLNESISIVGNVKEFNGKMELVGKKRINFLKKVNFNNK